MLSVRRNEAMQSLHSAQLLRSLASEAAAAAATSGNDAAARRLIDRAITDNGGQSCTTVHGCAVCRYLQNTELLAASSCMARTFSTMPSSNATPSPFRLTYAVILAQLSMRAGLSS